MKFLIVDDDDDIREVLSMLVASNYDVNIFEAHDGQNAIEVMHSDGPFDMIICDFNMPRKNGADVYTELRTMNASTPFILVSTAHEKFAQLIPNPTFFRGINKPFNETDLTQKIEEMISMRTLPPQKESYIPVTIDLLEKIEQPGVPLFLKLNASQYIKVLKETAAFDKNEAIRFKNKKQAHLYVELLDIKTLISNFRKNVFSKIDWDSVDSQEALNNLETDWQLILDVSRNLGWSSSVTEMTKLNIAKTIALIEKNPQLKKISDQLKLSKSKNTISPHCYSMILLATAILKELSWDSASTIRKMTFAALLHDMDLSDTMFGIKQDLITKGNLSDELTKEANHKIFNHTIVAAEFVSHWTSCPPDVDKLILQHHEKFDGTGFPHKMNFLNMFPLAGVFIIAEDLIYNKINHADVSMSEYLKSKEHEYSKGDFKKVYAAAAKVVQDVA